MKVLGVFDAANEPRVVPAGSVIFEAGDEGEGEEMFGAAVAAVDTTLAVINRQRFPLLGG